VDKTMKKRTMSEVRKNKSSAVAVKNRKKHGIGTKKGVSHARTFAQVKANQKKAKSTAHYVKKDNARSATLRARSAANHTK
jgi:hypothetical protein